MGPKWYTVFFYRHAIIIFTGGMYVGLGFLKKGRVVAILGMALLTLVIYPFYTPVRLKTSAHVAPHQVMKKSTNIVLHHRRMTSVESEHPKKVTMLVVCASFLGQPATKPLSLYQNLYFGSHQSVASYYRKVSYGQLQLTGEVVGDPLRPGKFLPLPHSESYYAKTENGSGGNFPNNDDGVVSDVINQLVKDHFNFKPFVKDGQIPYLAIVYSGFGADVEPNNKNLIWPVESNLQYPIVIPLNDRQKPTRLYGGSRERTSLPSDVALVNAYDLVPELDDSSGDPVTLGVIAHEFGHLLGLMDVYDVSSAANAGQGVGPFSLMGTGNWNGFPSGEQPAGLDPYSLIYLGWVKPKTITESETGVPLPPLETTPIVYQLNPLNFSNEYFLLSNEEAIGVDVAIPDTGVFIWRIDATEVMPSSYDWTNDVLNDPTQNHSHHDDIAIISAGNTNDLLQPEGAVGTYQDAYPVNGNNQFTSLSKPSNRLWNGQYLGMNVTHIAINPVTKVATFDVTDVQSGNSLVIPRPTAGLTVKVGVPVRLRAVYTHDGISSDMEKEAVWSTNIKAKWQGSQVTFLTSGQAKVNVSYNGLSALAYFNVVNH